MSENNQLQKILEQEKREYYELDKLVQEIFQMNQMICELKSVKYKNNKLRIDLKNLKEKLYENLLSIQNIITEEDEEYEYIKILIEKFKINN